MSCFRLRVVTRLTAPLDGDPRPLDPWRARSTARRAPSTTPPRYLAILDSSGGFPVHSPSPSGNRMKAKKGRIVRKTKKIAAALATTSAAGFALLAGAGVAQAEPRPANPQSRAIQSAAGPCYAYRNGSYSWAATSTCPAETYWWQHRVIIKCTTQHSAGGGVHTYYGPWVGGTSQSTAVCPYGDTTKITYTNEQGPDEG